MSKLPTDEFISALESFRAEWLGGGSYKDLSAFDRQSYLLQMGGYVEKQLSGGGSSGVSIKSCGAGGNVPSPGAAATLAAPANPPASEEAGDSRGTSPSAGDQGGGSLQEASPSEAGGDPDWDNVTKEALEEAIGGTTEGETPEDKVGQVAPSPPLAHADLRKQYGKRADCEQPRNGRDLVNRISEYIATAEPPSYDRSLLTEARDTIRRLQGIADKQNELRMELQEAHAERDRAELHIQDLKTALEHIQDTIAEVKGARHE